MHCYQADNNLIGDRPMTSTKQIVLSTALSLLLMAQNLSKAAAQSLSSSLSNLPFHQTTVLASHNAHANRAAANSFFETLGINQENSIYHQLNVDGVRALLLDIQLDGDELRLVHGPLDYGSFAEEIEKNLVPFLEGDEDAVVSLYLQTVGDENSEDEEVVRAEILVKLKDTFERLVVNGVPLKELTFKHNDERWSNHNEWPTMNELRAANQRLFVFSDRSEFYSSQYGFMHNRQVLRENDWRGILSCDSRFMWQSNKVSLPNNTKWSRLFFMNHFCCESGAESYGTTIPSGSPLLGGGDNGWGVLYRRIEMCMRSNGGERPNFIALDWVVHGEEARDVARFLNFGGGLGTGQSCESDEHCATFSCNTAAGLCQCQKCSEEGCGGCENGQICLSNGESLNECRSIQIKQQNEQIEQQTGTYFCGESYLEAIESCNTNTQCPNGNDDCPESQVCFGPHDCTSSSVSLLASTPQPSTSDAENQDVPQLSIEDLLQPSPPSSQSSPPTLGVASPDFSPVTPPPLPSITSSTTPSIVTTESPVKASTMYCGESYDNAKETCSEQTACPGGYECPTGTVCFQGIKCFTRPPSRVPTVGPTAHPTTEPTATLLTPSKSPTVKPTTKSPTDRPTFDFDNQFFCGFNYTDAQQTCYTTKACPDGDPSVCKEGQTCYSGIKCVAPPSDAPTLSPTETLPVSLAPVPGGSNGNGFGSSSSSTTAPFIWPKSSGEKWSLTFSIALVFGYNFALHILR